MIRVPEGKYFRLGGILDNMIVGSDVINEAVEAQWCASTQQWIEATSEQPRVWVAVMGHGTISLFHSEAVYKEYVKFNSPLAHGQVTKVC